VGSGFRDFFASVETRPPEPPDFRGTARATDQLPPDPQREEGGGGRVSGGRVVRDAQEIALRQRQLLAEAAADEDEARLLAAV